MTKKGFHLGVQRFKCANCGKIFLDITRLNPNLIWEDYFYGKQTYTQLSIKYGCTVKTIQRKIDSITIEKNYTFSSIANVLIDTTYFGRTLGVMVFKNSINGEFLLHKFVKHETNKLYIEGIEEIARRGVKIQSIICDGRKGLFTLFGADMPVQMCIYHQVAILKRYLTKNPKMQASKELSKIGKLLKKTCFEIFASRLQVWYNQWETFLNERKFDEKGKYRYIHKNLRSAYRSLKTNLPVLFTWDKNRALNIPKTTNGIDGHFADLKNKLRIHNGLSIERKKKFIDEFFKA